MNEAIGPADGADVTMEELTIDENLSETERIKTYITSSIALQRLVHVRAITTCAKHIGCTETCREILPLLKDVATDDEPVIREAFADQLAELATFFAASGDAAAYTCVLNDLLPLLRTLIRDSDTQVRMVAAEALLSVAQQIRKENLEQHILSMVQTLAHDVADDDNRILAIQILNELSAFLGQELCQRYAAEELVKLGNDHEFSVRKSVALNLGRICQISGADFTKANLLPALRKLVGDDVWGVRKACAESMATISSALDPADRATEIVPLFTTLINDGSRWVRNTAFEQLGHMLATLQSHEITKTLLTYYVSMANPKHITNDSNLSYQCAFSFPAVVQAVGAARWPELSGAFNLLIKDIQWKIRRTLAFSLHEIAKILGPQLTETQLVPAFDLFLKDLDEVKIGVLKHLYDFISILNPPSREKYLPVFEQLQSDADPWRFRKILSRQLHKLVGLYQTSDVHLKLSQLAIRLCIDSVSRVRSEAYKTLAAIFEALKDKAEWKREFSIKLAAFALQNSYQDRLIFIGACSYILDTSMVSTFETELLPRLLVLARDKVANVRLALAKFLYSKLMRVQQFAFNREVLATLGLLKSDSDWDVAFYANGEDLSLRGARGPVRKK